MMLSSCAEALSHVHKIRHVDLGWTNKASKTVLAGLPANTGVEGTGCRALWIRATTTQSNKKKTRGTADHCTQHCCMPGGACI